MSPTQSAQVIWHETECGSYEADLALWQELASERPGPILELGCGSGRVMLHLSRHDHDAYGIDSDRQLIEGLPKAEHGDARDLDLDRRFGLILAPMQLIQLLAGSEERQRCLRSVAAHLANGGLAAFAIVESMPAPTTPTAPLPDAREVDGWVYSSLPIDARVDAHSIQVRRLRQTVSPAGELEEELYEVELLALDANALEREAGEAGLRPAGRRLIPPTDAHVGSTVVLLEKEG